MNRSRAILAGLVVIALGLMACKKLSSKSYEPIAFMGATYEHVEDNEVNKVENHFFTPGGVAVAGADEFIQISKYDYPDLTPQQVRLVQKQVINSFGLQAVEGSDDRFFGVFEGTVPVYGHMRADAFVIKVGPQHRAANVEALRTTAGVRIDELSRVSSDF
jgi:hypothetical protein